MKKILFTTALIISITFNAYAYESGDFQIWNTNEQSVTIGKSTKFTNQQEFRYGNGAGDIFYQHYDWGFAFAFDKMLELALGYRLVYYKPKDKWMEEDHYYTNITPNVSNEIFISSNGTGFNQNRLESGIELGLTKYVKMDVSYMQQQVRGLNNKWVKANVLWLR